jgi:ribosomal protein L22
MGARKRLRAEKIKEANKSIAFARLNKSPIAPRKMRLVADLVRGVEVNWNTTLKTRLKAWVHYFVLRSQIGSRKMKVRVSKKKHYL